MYIFLENELKLLSCSKSYKLTQFGNKDREFVKKKKERKLISKKRK